MSFGRTLGRIGLEVLGMPLQGISYAVSGKSVGGAIQDGDFMQTRKAQRAEDVSRAQQDLARNQSTRASQLAEELDAMGRPVMDAQVARQTEVASLAEQYAREGMPEAQRQAAVSDIERNQAMQLGAASSLGAGLRGLGNTQASTAQAYRGLAAQDAMIAQQNQGQYLNSLSALGAAEQNAQQFNEIQPYYEKMQEMQSLAGAGQQNQMAQLMFAYQQAAQGQQTAVNLLGTGAQVGAQALMAGSDVRLKENIKEVGRSESGIPMYEWNYKGTPATERYRGAMAQDLINLGHKDAVATAPNGYYAVDYSKIDVEFTKL